jgi:uncharacterized protein YndB with AHSA1/START domain
MNIPLHEATSVRKEVLVPASPDIAFSVFVDRFADWWPNYRITTGDLDAFVLEPGPGGRWYERTTDGRECTWGHVLHWDPPRRVTLGWAIDGRWNADPDSASEVDVTFEPDGEGTRVVLVHRHLDRAGDGWLDMRALVGGPGGWGAILDRYAALVPA